MSFGVLEDDVLYDLTSIDPRQFADLGSAYALSRSGESLTTLLAERMKEATARKYDYELLKMPVVPAEVWGAGVTYLRSRQARESETKTKGLYDYVYEAPRPELFLKDSGQRCVGAGEEVCVRSDSKWTVPEPELTVVLDQDANIFGYTIGNDMSARDIEGQNALYLPQSKIYRGSCSIGPVVTTVDEIPDPHSLEVEMKILRSGSPVFEGRVNTSQMKRRVSELVRQLQKDNVMKTFTLLMTGTSIVPPDDFTLRDGDVVEMRIERIGILRNPVRQLR